MLIKNIFHKRKSLVVPCRSCWKYIVFHKSRKKVLFTKKESLVGRWSFLVGRVGNNLVLRLRPPEATGGPPQTINKEGEWPVFVFLFVFHNVFVFLLVSEFEDGSSGYLA